MIAAPTAEVIVATADGKFAGSAIMLFRKNSEVARLYSIGVMPGHQGRGVGLLLLKTCERRRRRRARIRLEVRADNAPAIGLYRSRGYAEFGQRQHYYPDLTDALRFEKVFHINRGQSNS